MRSVSVILRGRKATWFYEARLSARRCVVTLSNKKSIIAPVPFREECWELLRRHKIEFDVRYL